MLLGRQLVSNYEQAKPNLVSVVLESNGFNDLLDKITYLRDAQQQQQAIIRSPSRRRRAPTPPRRAWPRWRRASARSRSRPRQRVQALAGMNMLLHSKQSALAEARSAQQGALAASRRRAPRFSRRSARSRPSRPPPSGPPRWRPSSNSRRRRAVRRVVRRGFGRADAGRPDLRTVRRLGDPVRDRAVRVGWPEPDPELRRRLGLLPDHAPPPGSCSAAAARRRTWRASPSRTRSRGRIWNGGAGASNWVCAGIVGIH